MGVGWRFWRTEVTTTSKPRKPRQQRPTIKPPKEPGVRGAAKRHWSFWKKAKRVLKPRKKGTFFGGTREVLLAAIGLGLVVSIVGRAIGSTAGMFAGLGIAGGAGLGRWGWSIWKQHKQDKSPNVWKPGQPPPHWPKPPIATPYRPPTTSKPKPGGPAPNPCRAACRKSKKPKSTCKCKAVPCLHGQDA